MRLWSRIAITLLSIGLVYLASQQRLDQVSEGHIDQTLQRALAAFAIARGLNAVISVAQGTEFAIQPAGVGVNFAPGELLDPINDLVERFSWVMLASSSSLGLQKILLNMSQWVWVSAFLALALLAYLAPLWLQWAPPQRVRQLLYKLVIMALLARFLVPVMSLLNESVYQAFLQPDYESSLATLQRTTEEIDHLNQESLPKQQEQPEGLWDKAKALYDNTRAMVDFRAERYQVLAEQATESTITLIVAFVLQTLLLPLLFLWLLVRVARWVANSA